MHPLSKTDFILWRECPQNVWVKRRASTEYKGFEVSAFEQALAEMGNDVEALARGMFPDGYLIERRSAGAQELTQELMAKKQPVIFQAVFATDKYLAATDVLQWNEEAGAYDLYEIKMSSTSANHEESDEEDAKPNKKREEQYEYDISFQANVLLLCGTTLNKKYLVRLNREYVRNGDLDFTPGALFIIEDKTEAVEKRMPVAIEEMERAHEYLTTMDLNGPCPCIYRGRSSHCTAFTYINPHVPPYSVHDLNRIGNSKKVLTELVNTGILAMDDLSIDDPRLLSKPRPDNLNPVPRKRNQVKAHRTQTPIVDYIELERELSGLTFPLYFLDYETYPTAIPPYDRYHPYQQIVFQYSLHVLRSADSEPEHYEKLVLDGEPSERIAQSLRENIGDSGTVVSWFKLFENSRNHELAALNPEYADFFASVIGRTYDLMDIVHNQHYVHPGFRGRASIKNVLPVLAPHLSYKSLGVQNGTDAIHAYKLITEGALTGEDAEKKRQEMLEYCKLDTRAMYEIWKFFTALLKK